MRARLIAVALAVAGAVGCTESDPEPPPCAYRARGAAWLAYGTGEAGSWDVVVMRADRTCRVTIANDPSVDLHPAWAPGGVVAYDSSRAPWPSVWIQAIETGVERRLDVGDLRAASPAFSPDGQTVAFEGRPPGALLSSIYVVPVAGGTPLELTPEATPHGNGGPVFSPDGATIYFVSNRNGPWDVFKVPSGGGPAVPVTTGAGVVGKAAISPDGATLAFTRATLTSTEVVLYALGTETTTPLGIDGASEPAFDPAGDRLAIRVFRGAYSTLDLAPLSGTGPVRLTLGPGPDGAPAFAPPGP